MRKKSILLKHSINLSLVRGKLGNLNPVKQYFSVTWFFKACNDSKGGCLSASAGSQKRQEFLFVNIQIDAAQNLLIIKILGQIF